MGKVEWSPPVVLKGPIPEPLGPNIDENGMSARLAMVHGPHVPQSTMNKINRGIQDKLKVDKEIAESDRYAMLIKYLRGVIRKYQARNNHMSIEIGKLRISLVKTKYAQNLQDVQDIADKALYGEID